MPNQNIYFNVVLYRKLLAIADEDPELRLLPEEHRFPKLVIRTMQEKADEHERKKVVNDAAN